MRGASVGALVATATGDRVFAHNEDRLLIPASNAKVLTALAALETFGPTHRFHTKIYADRPISTDGSVGRLVAVGGGDPSLTSEQLWRLAADLARLGLRRIDGDLVLDATIFDDVRWNPAWGKTSSRAYHAPVAGLAANYGAFTVEVRPGSATGERLRSTVDPPLPYFTLVQGGTTTRGRGAKLEVGRSSSANGDRVTIGGSLGASASPRAVYRSVTQPVDYAGALLRRQLAANDITSGGMRRGRSLPGDVLVHDFEGKPLSEIVGLFMKYSNNNIAETLVKAMGVHSGGNGSWPDGVAAMRKTLIGLGIDGSCYELVDGSGLARQNRIAPRCLVQALRRASASFRYGPELLASLPIGGRDGTLAKRTAASTDAVRAKTGLLSGATALSGIVESRSRGRLFFAIIANGYANGDAAAMQALDDFVAALRRL